MNFSTEEFFKRFVSHICKGYSVDIYLINLSELQMDSVDTPPQPFCLRLSVPSILVPVLQSESIRRPIHITSKLTWCGH